MTQWYQSQSDELLRQLSSDTTRGLSAFESQRRFIVLILQLAKWLERHG